MKTEPSEVTADSGASESPTAGEIPPERGAAGGRVVPESYVPPTPLPEVKLSSKMQEIDQQAPSFKFLWRAMESTNNTDKAEEVARVLKRYNVTADTTPEELENLLSLPDRIDASMAVMLEHLFRAAEHLNSKLWFMYWDKLIAALTDEQREALEDLLAKGQPAKDAFSEGMSLTEGVSQ